VHPQVADFITGRQTERYDFPTHTLLRGASTVDLFVKVAAIGNRFIVISYGYFPGTYSYALVYDIALKRWGKLRIVHRDCFSYTYQDDPVGVTYSMAIDVQYQDAQTIAYEDLVVAGEGITPAQGAMAFLKASGEVVVASWATRPNTDDTAVAIVGRIQLSRSRDTQLNRVEAEGVTSGDMLIQCSSDGFNIDRVVPLIDVIRSPGFLMQGEMIDCKNFNVVIEGTFSLSTLLIEGGATGSV
jgi:hypothetical protein